jgi:hypothetical protein
MRDVERFLETDIYRTLLLADKATQSKEFFRLADMALKEPDLAKAQYFRKMARFVLLSEEGKKAFRNIRPDYYPNED